MPDPILPRAPDAGSSATRPWPRRLTSPWAALVVLAAFYVLLLASLREKSATFDEQGHATAGYLYWKRGDYGLDPENGNLSKRWIALPYLLGGHNPPATNTPGFSDSLWRLADHWFNRAGNDVTSMLARGRAMSALVAVALGAVVWFWARHLFGPLAGMLALLLYALNPTILANGGLMTSDTPAAFGFLIALGSIWATLHRISVARVIAGVFAIGVLFLVKMSAPLILPIAALLTLARIIDGRPLPVGRDRLLAKRGQQLAAFALVALVQTAGIVAMVWAFYGFRYSAFPPDSTIAPRFDRPWEWVFDVREPRALLAELSLTADQQRAVDAALPPVISSDIAWSFLALDRLEELQRRVLTPTQSARLAELRREPPRHWVLRIIHLAREHRLLPEAFLYGYANVWKTSSKLAAFLNGEISNTGWRSFFPFTFAVKTPLALLGLLGLALVAAFAVWQSHTRTAARSRARVAWELLYPVLPLLLLFFGYWAIALSSNLNIGHRHLLPTYPPLLILTAGVAAWCFREAGAAASWSTSRRAMAATVAILVGLHAAETAYRFPNYLAYFNGIIRPDRAYRHVVDSSLDWGQELPAIARYLRERPGERAHLAYFGVGSPARYGIRAQHLGGFTALDWRLAAPMKPLFGVPAAEIEAFLREHPEYDASLAFRLDTGKETGILLTHRASAHRLGAGLYVISASTLQPLYHGRVEGFWNAAHEREYQRIKAAVAPFLTDDPQARIAAVSARPVAEWISLFDDFYDFRLARLTTFLRAREPDDIINHSVLVYRLSEADVARAIDGPL